MHGADDARSEALRDRILRAVAGAEVAKVVALGDPSSPGSRPACCPRRAGLLDAHAAAGEDRLVVSASPIEIVGRLAEAIGLEGAVGTVSEIADGRYTGRLAGAFCYGPGKVEAVRTLAAQRGYDLAACSAYSDSVSDLPFLELVGNPVAVNPDAELRDDRARARLARRRGGPEAPDAPAPARPPLTDGGDRPQSPRTRSSTAATWSGASSCRKWPAPVIVTCS